MNAPERNVVRLAFCLLVIGIVMRFLPWGLPSIESFEVGDALIVANEEAPPAIVGVSKNDTVLQIQPKKEPKKRKNAALPVHINTASVDELCALNGVGPKLAEKILGVREANGPFKNPEDLKKVPGIGKKKLEKLLPGVIFD
ncbi:MAG: helix-hairpin-helix domain-containing protein [Fibrobacter sp.]|nr:helix-hairpin-helix domain-containing protein [Fibrobacter sp.]